ncbi:DNA processing protein [Anseongella ginsenosidimutans]|uniref:DNA processing protein n=1 Tax=Anseongella ginsenosidimutans TaxID=496056 RepID=A0A4R3KTB5_9SPHI|nr:DNA-processing protein DprA [Anseongella ginsenosidimutans]QEC53305.1 DNA-protecting protein DprA [Anseongella ginsenosidimutans]TCS88180.1 DNA processing protein [Anseongella ginsenosidimutans]
MSRLHQLALTLLPGIGPVLARKLLDHYGSGEAVFRESAKDLVRLPGIGEKLVRSFMPPVFTDALKQAEAELKIAEKAGTRLLFYLDKSYPRRLKHCHDAPVLLFFRGNTNIDHPRVVSIVGSRRATPYGNMLCETLVEGLRPYDPLIISGLAYGIDVTAHRAALKNKLATIGVLGHGLNRIYPAAHSRISRDMEQEGGLLSEFFHDFPALPENFPKRNRIVAGLSDATIVVEANEKGGALITADIASSYDREVFAFPGRLRDENSRGCLRIIRDHKAQLITGAADVAWYLGWDKKPDQEPSGNAPSGNLTEEERKVLQIIIESGSILIDDLRIRADFSQESLFFILLQLEMHGFISNIPGKGYVYCK